VYLLAQTQFPTLDIGAVDVASQSVPVSASFSLTGQSAAPAFSLLYGSEFEIGGASCGGGFASCTAPVTFKPIYPGVRTDVVLVRDQANNLIGRMVLTGTGTGPQASVAPGLATPLQWDAVGVPPPDRFVIDPAGNLYALVGNQIFKRNVVTQVVSVFAGTLRTGYSGDNGPAVDAQLNLPSRIALDRNGNLFVADRLNHAIRKIDLATGIITTAVGTGVAGRSDTGPALSTPISYPIALTTDPEGNLYFIEGNGFGAYSDYKVRKVDAATQTLSVFAGTGQQGYSGDDGPAAAADIDPVGLATDASGNVYIVQQGTHYLGQGGIVRVVSNGIISRFAGDEMGSTDVGAPALSSYFYSIGSLTFDAADNAYFVEGETCCTNIRKISAVGSRTTSNVFGPPRAPDYYMPQGVTLDADGSYYISSYMGPKKVATQAAPLAFASANAGKASTPLLLTYYNTGNDTLQVSGISVAGANASDFTQHNDCGTSLPAGGSCTITVTFTPQVMGARSGTLTIVDNAPGSPRIVSLSGTGLTPQQAVLSPSSLSFGPQNGGTVSAPQTVTLSNPGIAPLAIDAIAVTNPSFAITHDCPSTLPAGGQCTISVTFSPRAEGPTFNEKLVVTDDASNSPQTVAISGSGQAFTYQLSISPAALNLGIASIHDFGARSLTTQSIQTISVQNTGNGYLPFFSTQIDGPNTSEFFASNNCPNPLAPGSACTISVTFTPKAVGLRTASLKVYSYSNIIGLPQTIALYGTGYLQPSVARAASGYLRVSTDFDGDGKSDLASYRPDTGIWEIAESSNPSSITSRQWGTPEDIPVPGDYDGDGRADVAVWRPSNGMWYVSPSSNPSAWTSKQWGTAGDVPLVCDFDGDGKADFTVWRPATGMWYVVPSSNPNAPLSKQWGMPGDIPIPGDFDGDGRADFAVWRPANGVWYIVPSSAPTTTSQTQWGEPGDAPVGVDFDGDGKTDLAIWRPLTGMAPSSNPSAPWTQQLGLPGDIPAPADLDGDGKADFAVWRPSTATWYVVPVRQPSSAYTKALGQAADIPLSGTFAGDGWPRSAIWHPETGVWTVKTSSSTTIMQQWGLPGDIPLVSDFDGDAKADLAVWRPSNGTWYIIPSSNPVAPITQQWGSPGDIPLTGDFDGDGKTDFAVWRPSSGTWYVIPSKNPSSPIVRQWGLPGDVPLTGDYDGDLRSDFIVWRPWNGTWYIVQSRSPETPVSIQWGLPGDIPLTARLKDVFRSNLVVWRPSNGTWYVYGGAKCQPLAFGLPGDVPVVLQESYMYGLYDLLALWRPSQGLLWGLGSGCSYGAFEQMGAALDVPL
jgi:hypothetical protein